jgi:hypothetical protein
MLPEVETFLKAMDDARSTYDQEHRDVPPGCPGCWPTTGKERAACEAKQDERNAAVNKVVSDYAARKRAALEPLQNSEDKFIAFIATHVWPEYQGEAREVLQRLPMSRSELDALAAENGYCREYNRFVRLATEAGVMLRDTDLAPHLEALVLDLARTTGERYDVIRSVVTKHLPNS